MLFGFIVAAIAGFLLTAVPSWTGARGFAGWPLATLVALWTLGRVCLASSASWPALLVAVLDLSFLPVLAVFVLPPLLRARNRNTPLLAVLTALWLTNVGFYWGIGRDDAALARHGQTHTELEGRGRQAGEVCSQSVGTGRIRTPAVEIDQEASSPGSLVAAQSARDRAVCPRLSCHFRVSLVSVLVSKCRWRSRPECARTPPRDARLHLPAH